MTSLRGLIAVVLVFFAAAVIALPEYVGAGVDIFSDPLPCPPVKTMGTILG